MHVCYVDESGNNQILDQPDAPPVLVIAGVTFAESCLKELVWQFLALKKQFNPTLKSGKLSDLIRTEVKGANLRADIRSSSRRRNRRAVGFLDNVLDLLEVNSATITGEIWVKNDGAGISSGFYPDAIANIAASFQAQMAAAQSRGMMILDAQTKVKNVPSVNGITTRRYKTGGDALHCMIESPLFGHSDAHVALQIADIVASALLFPMACSAFCGDLHDNAHTQQAYGLIQQRYGARLRDLEHRYVDADGVRRGGIRVRNKRNHLPGHRLYAADGQTVVPMRSHRERKRTRSGLPTIPTQGHSTRV